MTRGHKVRWATFVFIILVFFVADHDLRYSAKYDQIQEGSAEALANSVEEGNLPRRFALILLGTFAFASLVLVKRPPLVTARRSGLFFALFIVWSFASILWAADKSLSLRRVTEFFFVAVGAFVIARRHKLRGLLELTFAGTLFYFMVGFICEVVLGKFAPLDGEYRFCGTLHPNHQGWNCAFLLLSSLGLARGTKRWRAFFVMIALVALIFLILTKSRTSFLCLVLSLVAYWSLVWTRTRKVAMFSSAIGVFCLFLLFAGHSAFPTLRNSVLLGRTDTNAATLTDRTIMWQASLPYLAEKPFLGYGFNSFWSPERILVVSSEVGFPVPAEHNDYLSLLLGVGIPGLVLFVIVLGGTLARFLKGYRYSSTPSTATALTIVLFCCLTMATEVLGFSTCLPTFIFYSLLFANPPLGHAWKPVRTPEEEDVSRSLKRDFVTLSSLSRSALRS